MSQQGILGQVKPGATGEVLYAAPPDQSASLAITIANDGTGAAYDVALKNYDQKLTLDANTYKLHKGDVISSYRVEVDTAFSSADFTPGELIQSNDLEKSFKFESFTTPVFTEIFVKAESLRNIAVEAANGSFSVGDTITKGVSPDDTTAVIYEAVLTDGAGTLRIGPSTINGAGTEFTDADSISTAGGAAATVSVGGVPAAATASFVFSTTTAGAAYAYRGPNGADGTIEFFNDRIYRFNVSDSSMAGRDFKLSEEINGEWGPDNVFGTADDGTEFTTGKTTNGTAGSVGAYVQYDFGASSIDGNLYFYDGGTGTVANNEYGGDDRTLISNDQYEYTDLFVYDIEGTWTNAVDTFTAGGVTYTVTAQTAGPYGYVRSYSGTTLYVIKGSGSQDFAGTDTFFDVPAYGSAARTLATVSSVDVATTASEAANLIADGVTNSANNVDRITSVVLGPGERILVSSATANNAFTAVGFEDNSSDLNVSVYSPTAPEG